MCNGMHKYRKILSVEIAEVLPSTINFTDNFIKSSFECDLRCKKTKFLEMSEMPLD